MIVAVVDFSTHPGHQAAERLRTLIAKHGYSVAIVGSDFEPTFKYTHLVLSPDWMTLSEFNDSIMKLPEWIINSGVPVLGLGYGMALMAKTMGATVTVADEAPISSGFGAWMDSIQVTPKSKDSSTLVTEFIRDRQVTNSRQIPYQLRVTSLNKKFPIVGVTETDEVAVFTNGDGWTGLIYDPTSQAIPDFEPIQRFLNSPVLWCRL